jgi:hypothetical protein
VVGVWEEILEELRKRREMNEAGLRGLREEICGLQSEFAVLL